MAIQQQYYTSCQNQKLQKTGFQVKAESPGISGDTNAILSKIIGYSIPSQADISAIDTHPVALRYYAANETAMLICSQSNGKDEVGRAGNFFAHSIVATPLEIAYPLAPIFYWKSPFWVSKDESNEIELPAIEEFNAEVVFDFDAIWTFLSKGERRQWFHKLLCAVIDHHESQRKIVILDDDESVALWIAAVSTALPPRYSHFLTFATYHHDPSNVPFMITGTTADSYFRVTNDAYISYFIINAVEGRISEAPSSDYANYILERFDQEQYNNEILEFFNWVERFDTQSQVISRRLDNFANFNLATVNKSLAPESAKAIAAARSVTNDVLQKSTIESDDITDLRAACKILGEAAFSVQNSELIQDYSQGLQALKRLDKNFLQTGPEAFYVFATLVLQKRQQEANILSNVIVELYSQPLLINALNIPEFIQKLGNQLQEDDWEQITIFWNYLGKDFNLKPTNALPLILTKTFAALQRQATSNNLQVPDAAAKILNTLLKAKGIPPQSLLNSATQYQQQHSTSPVLEWIYYALVEKLPLEQRKNQYWRYWTDSPTLYSYELQRDLLKSAIISQAVQVIQSWFNNINDRQRIVTEAVNYIWSLSQFNQQQLAHQLLLEKNLMAVIDNQLYNQLVESFMSTAKICKVDNSTIEVYQDLLANKRLHISQRYLTIMKGAIDLYQRIISTENISEYQKYFYSATSETYEQEVGELMNEFFASKLDPNAHFKLVVSVYNPNHREDFWKVYWAKFEAHLLEQRRIDDIINIMNLWFTDSVDLMVNYRYVVPEFFTELPSLISAIKSSKSYHQIERELHSKLKRKDWYPVIDKYFQQSRKGFLGIF